MSRYCVAIFCLTFLGGLAYGGGARPRPKGRHANHGAAEQNSGRGIPSSAFAPRDAARLKRQPASPQFPSSGAKHEGLVKSLEKMAAAIYRTSDAQVLSESDLVQEGLLMLVELSTDAPKLVNFDAALSHTKAYKRVRAAMLKAALLSSEVDDLQSQAPSNASDDPLDRLIQAEATRHLDAHRLDLRDAKYGLESREIRNFGLHLFEGLNVTEIAAREETTRGRVQGDISKVKVRLRLARMQELAVSNTQLEVVRSKATSPEREVILTQARNKGVRKQERRNRFENP